MFRALGSEARLRLIETLAGEPLTVSALTTATGMSQPLVSQHLATLREIGAVTVTRHGREAIYEIADAHIAHIVTDALQHVDEERTDRV
nr:metalloregulator ArsR/SmtB family transcription factor [Microcella alkalica]